MKFTIVTCTWNSAATLAETIGSVNAQRGAQIEHVFVDGGSTDGTLEIIESMAPNAVVLRDRRGGISRAMNDGIAAATGDVIAHLHSDDFYASPDVLSTVQAAFAGAPQSRWLVGRMDVLRDGRRIAAAAPRHALTLQAFRRGAVSIPHPAVFIRRDLFDECGGFEEHLKYAMDIDLWLRLLPVATPLTVHDTLAVFREHAGSVSTANVLAARQEERRVRHSRWASAPLSSLIYELRFRKRFRRLQQQLAQGLADGRG